MIHPKLLMATAILASVAMTACSDTTDPNQPAQEGLSSGASPRSGTLRVTKACPTYTGRANDFCTITSSSLKEIEVGSKVIYLSAASAEGFLESDVRLDPPGPGNNIGYGHCSVDLTAINGTRGCVFSGGTGKFTWFHADVLLSLLGSELVWNGTYRFSPRD